MAQDISAIGELMLKKYEKEIVNVYGQAYRETRKKLNDYMNRFDAKDAIKQKLLQQGKITQKEYIDWRRGQILIGKRWREMVDTLTTDFVNADHLAMSILKGYLPEMYALNHNYGTFQVEKFSLVDTSYTLYDRQTVERLIRDHPQLLPKPRVNIPADQRWNRQHVQNTIIQGVLQGEDLRKISKRLQNVAGMDKRSAMRNARTMMTGAENAGRCDSYERASLMGIDVEKEWLSTLDGRTRDSHRHLDGEHVKLNEKFSNGCRFPGDPEGPAHEVYNCRCTLVPHIRDEDQSDAPRFGRLGTMTYDEWKYEHSPKNADNK